MKKMLGRVFDENTFTWRYPGGGGTPIPDEHMPTPDSNGNVSVLDLWNCLTARDNIATAIKQEKKPDQE